MKVERTKPVSVNPKLATEYAVAVAKEFQRKDIAATRYMGGGSFGRAVLIRYADGTECVVKLLCTAGMLEKETFDLKLLKEHCTLKIPEVFYVRESGGNLPVDAYCMEKLEGKPAMTDIKLLLSGKKLRQSFADAVISGLGAIHAATNKKFGDTLSPVYDSWRMCYGEFAEQVYDKAVKLGEEGAFPKRITRVMAAAWKAYDEIFRVEPEEAVLIHGDLNVLNIMTDDSHRPVGFIDPLNSMYADREYDLFQFRNLTGKRFKLTETYLKKYGASGDCEDKLAFYGLWNEVYCFIRSGVLIPSIMNPLVRNMKRRLNR